jgi:hypothetical protein
MVRGGEHYRSNGVERRTMLEVKYEPGKGKRWTLDAWYVVRVDGGEAVYRAKDRAKADAFVAGWNAALEARDAEDAAAVEAGDCPVCS